MVFFDVVEVLRGVVIRSGGVLPDIWPLECLRRSTHGNYLAAYLSGLASHGLSLGRMEANSTDDGRSPASAGTPKKGRRFGQLSSFGKKLRKRGRAKLITDAQTAPGDNRRRREVVYSILQFLRIPALLISFYLMYAHHAWVLAAIICAVTVPLPWIAVIIANESREKKDPRERNVYKPAVARAMQQDMAAGALTQPGPQNAALGPGPDTIDHSPDDASSATGNPSDTRDDRQ